MACSLPPHPLEAWTDSCDVKKCDTCELTRDLVLPTNPTWRRRDVVIVSTLQQALSVEVKLRTATDERVQAGMSEKSRDNAKNHRLLPRNWLSVLHGIQREQRRQKWVQQTVLSLQAQPAPTVVLRNSGGCKKAKRPPVGTKRCRIL